MEKHQLIELAKDSNVWVRCSVAANPSAPPSVLNELASDPSQEVRSHVGSNPSTPVHTLARLAADLVPVVRASAKNNPSAQNTVSNNNDRLHVDSNPSTPVQTFARLANDLVPVGRASVKNSPFAQNGVSYSNEKIRRLRDSKHEGGTKPSQVQVKKPTNRRRVDSNRLVVDAQPGKRNVERPYEQVSGTESVLTLLKPDDAIDQLIARLIVICRRGADFLEARDSKRYVYFLRDLSAFKIPSYLRTWITGSRSTVRTGILPINELRHVIGHWVMSYFGDANPLMPHFALNTAEFIHRMMRGCREEGPDGLRIEPVVEGTFEERLHFDLEFQREFRRKFNPTTRVVVPSNAEFVWSRKLDGQSVAVDYLPSGSVFAFDVTECYLSDTLTDTPQIVIRGEQCNPKPDICRDFQLHGAIRPLSSSPTIFGQYLEQRGSGQFVKVPFRWVTDVVVLNPNGKTAALLPMPTWIEDRTWPRTLSVLVDEVSQRTSNKKTPAPIIRNYTVPSLSRPAKLTAEHRASDQPTSISSPKRKLTPEAVACFICGKPLKPSMHVWRREMRFCKVCKYKAS
jgi:hypothetical protein